MKTIYYRELYDEIIPVSEIRTISEKIVKDTDCDGVPMKYYTITATLKDGTTRGLSELALSWFNGMVLNWEYEQQKRMFKLNDFLCDNDEGEKTLYLPFNNDKLIK